MATLILRHTPEFLHRWLKESASLAHRSMNQHTLFLLEQLMSATITPGNPIQQPIPSDLPGLPRTRLTDLWECFAARYEVAPNTLQYYQQILRNFIKWATELSFADEVTRDLAEEYTRYICKQKHSANTELATLRRIWRTLWPDRTNPWETGLRLQTKPRERALHYRRLSLDEARRLFKIVCMEAEAESRYEDGRKTVPASFLEDLADGMVFAWHYGMRISSLAALQWHDFRFAASKGYFLHVPPKTKRIKPWPLEIPILPPIRAILQRRRKIPHTPESFLLPLFHDRYVHHPSAITTVVKRLREQVGVLDNHHGRATMHAFRATFVTRMDEAGAPSAVTDAITGHAPQTMHDHYSHVNLATKRRWLLKAIPPLIDPAPLCDENEFTETSFLQSPLIYGTTEKRTGEKE